MLSFMAMDPLTSPPQGSSSSDKDSIPSLVPKNTDASNLDDKSVLFLLSTTPLPGKDIFYEACDGDMHNFLLIFNILKILNRRQWLYEFDKELLYTI